MRKLIVISLLGLMFVFSGCSRLPTEKYSIVDNRPQISFKFQNRDFIPLYVVYVDNLNVGRAMDYIDDNRALRVLPGTHIIRVEKKGELVLEEKVYLGDGTAKTLVVY